VTLGVIPRRRRDIVVPGGEGILGLEAAIASLVEPGTEVLCLSNGLYGDGFADFVADYGGEATLVSADYDDSLPLAELESVLADDDREFDLATMVHCETPTGTLNDLGPALDLLDEAEGRSSPSSTPSRRSAASGAADRTDRRLSRRLSEVLQRAAGAHYRRDQRPRVGGDGGAGPAFAVHKFPPVARHCRGFPYTHLTTEVVALDAALGLLVVEEGLDAVRERHRAAATRCRERGAELGLEPYPAPGRSSPTVTAFHVPGRAEELQRRLREERDVLVATGLGELADDILRIGHMGHNARISRVDEAMDALGDVL